MPGFRYQATDARGKVQTGVMEAVSPAAARLAVRDRGLALVSMTADAAKTTRGSKMSLRSLTLVTRQLSTLTGSGLRIEEALQTIAGGQPPKVAAVILDIRTSLTEGRGLAQAMGDHPASFSEYYRASVKAGEQAGRLDKVLGHLANFVENRARNRQTVLLALLYPMLLGLVSLSIVTMLMIFVVPDIVKVFTSRGAALPFLTRVLIGVSAWVRSSGPFAAALALVVALGLAFWLRQEQNRQRLHKVLATSWLTRRLVQRMNAAQFAGTLATLPWHPHPAGAAILPRQRATCRALRDRRAGDGRRCACDRLGAPRAQGAVGGGGGHGRPGDARNAHRRRRPRCACRAAAGRRGALGIAARG